MNSRSCNVIETLDYDEATKTYQAQYDETKCPPSAAVVRMVAAITDKDLVKLAPLYSVVDPDALDALLANGSRDGDTAVEFHYLDHDVTIKSYGVITVRSRSADASERDR